MHNFNNIYNTIWIWKDFFSFTIYCILNLIEIASDPLLQHLYYLALLPSFLTPCVRSVTLHKIEWLLYIDSIYIPPLPSFKYRTTIHFLNLDFRTSCVLPPPSISPDTKMYAIIDEMNIFADSILEPIASQDV